jgi:hypothetical protein
MRQTKPDLFTGEVTQGIQRSGTVSERLLGIFDRAIQAKHHIWRASRMVTNNLNRSAGDGAQRTNREVQE